MPNPTRVNPVNNHHKFYQSWADMKKRCKRKPRHYENITYDTRWEKFLNFYEDMFSTWSKGLTLDRIDSAGNYSKENCRWATPKEQANNTKKNRKLTLNGLTLNLIQWSELTGIKSSTIRQRIDAYGWSVKDALTKEVRFAQPTYVR